MNILLTSAGRRGYLIDYFKESLRKLGIQGEIHAANSSALCSSLSEADRSVITPLIYDEAYIPFLLDYCSRNHIDAIISLFDIDLYMLSINRDRFSEIGTRIIVSDPAVIAKCNDKLKTAAFLTEAGINAPLTFVSEADALAALKDGRLHFPLIVKPRWGMGSLSIYEAENEAELHIFAEKVHKEIFRSYLKYEAAAEPESCVLFQEKIEGQEYGLDVINDLSGVYCNTIVKEKFAMRSGETDCSVTVSRDDAVQLGRTLSGKLGHIANLDVDIIEQKNTGKLYVIEMNARFGGGYPFSHIAGADLPTAIVSWLAGLDCDPDLLIAEPDVLTQKSISLVRLDSSILKS